MKTHDELLEWADNAAAGGDIETMLIAERALGGDLTSPEFVPGLGYAGLTPRRRPESRQARRTWIFLVSFTLAIISLTVRFNFG